MAICFDVDGVIADFSRGFSAVVQELTSGRAPLVEDYSEVKTWQWAPWYWPEGFSNELNEEAWAYIGRSWNFWANLVPLFPHDMSYLAPRARSVPIVFMTRREGPLAWEQTVAFLDRWNVREPLVQRVKSGEEKDTLCARLGINTIVDDNPKTLERCRDAGMNTIAMSWPYNEQVEGVRRATSLRQAIELAQMLDARNKKGA